MICIEEREDFMEPACNRSIKDYYFRTKIGQGSEGAIYQGFHVKLMKPIAIKVIPKSLL